MLLTFVYIVENVYVGFYMLFPFFSWKDKANIFRTHDKLKLKSVPTLLKWGTVSHLEDCIILMRF